jgi:hypothetical protein
MRQENPVADAWSSPEKHLFPGAGDDQTLVTAFIAIPRGSRNMYEDDERGGRFGLGWHALAETRTTVARCRERYRAVRGGA